MSIVLTILLVIAVLVGVLVAGGLLKGLDRKLTARMQGRVGPPVTQSFYDVIKLLGKQSIIAGRAQLVFAWAYLILIVVACALFVLRQDLLVTMLVFFLGTLCLPLGALSVKSPFSQIGGHRELLQFLAYEPLLLLAAMAMAQKADGFQISSILSSGHSLLPALWPTFVSLLLALTIIMRKSPFDISGGEHAHQEVVRGVLTEYSGPYLAIIEIGHWFEVMLVLAMVGLFWSAGSFWWLSAAIALAAWLVVVVIDNMTSRLTWSRMIGYSWSIGVPLIALNIVLINLGWM